LAVWSKIFRQKDSHPQTLTYYCCSGPTCPPSSVSQLSNYPIQFFTLHLYAATLECQGSRGKTIPSIDSQLPMGNGIPEEGREKLGESKSRGWGRRWSSSSNPLRSDSHTRFFHGLTLCSIRSVTLNPLRRNIRIHTHYSFISFPGLLVEVFTLVDIFRKKFADVSFFHWLWTGQL
jgi:hypothetical protein